MEIFLKWDLSVCTLAQDFLQEQYLPESTF
jgi:hypothetical protein